MNNELVITMMVATKTEALAGAEKLATTTSRWHRSTHNNQL
jgi:hypothetical protein